MYVEEVISKQRGKAYRTVLVRESYREQGHVKHRTLSNITRLPKRLIEQVKRFVKGDQDGNQQESLEIGSPREYGACLAFREILRRIELDRLIYSRKTAWRENVLAMIVGRIVYQGSKLSLTNRYLDSCLWEVFGYRRGERPDVDTACYEPLDQLLGAQSRIQKALAKRHLSDGCLILYDLTNVWLEGDYEASALAAYGRDKSGKHGYQQVAIGLLTDRRGCPIATEVFRGGISDQTTVKQQVERLSRQYGVKDIILAGDRGMLTPRRLEEVSEAGYKTLTALTHPQLVALLEKRWPKPNCLTRKTSPRWWIRSSPGCAIFCATIRRRESGRGPRVNPS